MNDIWMLIFFSLAMLIGCYVAGLIPLAFNLSEDKLQLVSALGAGLLVGTALAVIIPEGVNALYESASDNHHRITTSSIPKTMDPKHASVDPSGRDTVDSGDHASRRKTEIHSFIGVSLVLGFLFMMIVDQVFGGGHKSLATADMEANGVKQDRNKITTTLGLVVHAAADGVALGAAATTTRADIEMIVFLAIMLHKAPAAFGLVTFLLHDGLDRVRIRKHLLIFSLAAPIFSILTFFGISQKGKEALSSMNATGIAMLFSAGTFLYVATVHVLPEISNRPLNHNSDASSVTGEHKGFRKSELLALTIGALTPLLISVNHHH